LAILRANFLFQSNQAHHFEKMQVFLRFSAFPLCGRGGAERTNHKMLQTVKGFVSFTSQRIFKQKKVYFKIV
jgi:hypothetical protein